MGGVCLLVDFHLGCPVFSKHRPSGPMLSKSKCLSVCPCVHVFVLLSICSLLRYLLNVFLSPLPKVGCPIWVLGYSWSTLLWHRCYYPHRLRDALSPVCGIFSFAVPSALPCLLYVPICIRYS